MKNQGFTLTELMIAVAIVGILAAVALPRMAETVRSAIEGRTKANLAIMRHALLAYYGDYQAYPTDHLGDLIDKGYIQGQLPMIWEPPYHNEGNGVCVGPPTIDTLNTCTDAYVYDNDANSPTWGVLILSCIHQDLKGRPWSSY